MRPALLYSLLILIFNCISTPVHADKPIWISIDTSKLRLEVKQGNKTLVVMKNIAIGKNGAGIKKHRGDDITPLGSYTIGWINNNSRFQRFFGLTYPSLQNARTALLNGSLTDNEYSKIIKAHRSKQIPPQNTMIGGHIGIHGLGTADEKVHKLFNWTNGCIALTNKQINLLAQWVGKGTVVKVE